MKIVINKFYGGFGLSDEAVLRYAELAGITLYKHENEYGCIDYYRVPKYEYDDVEIKNPTAYSVLDSLMFFSSTIARNDPFLVQVVQELEEKANDYMSKLKVVEIPDDVDWEIHEHEGIETVVEKHRSWS